MSPVIGNLKVLHRKARHKSTRKAKAQAEGVAPLRRGRSNEAAGALAGALRYVRNLDVAGVSFECSAHSFDEFYEMLKRCGVH